MDLALNNLQRLVCHKTQPTNKTKQQQEHANRNGNKYNYMYISSNRQVKPHSIRPAHGFERETFGEKLNFF